MIQSYLFKDIQLVLPNQVVNGDVFIQDGKIQAIGPSLSVSAEQTIVDSGLTLMAGVIDSHVHFREPGATHKETIESGSKAAASGGVTTFLICPIPTPKQ